MNACIKDERLNSTGLVFNLIKMRDLPMYLYEYMPIVYIYMYKTHFIIVISFKNDSTLGFLNDISFD